MTAKQMGVTFEDWLAQVDKIGVREGIFDKPGARFLCPHSQIRRPYTGTDGFLYQLWQDRVPPEFAIGELLVEQDGV